MYKIFCGTEFVPNEKDMLGTMEVRSRYFFFFFFSLLQVDYKVTEGNDIETISKIKRWIRSRFEGEISWQSSTKLPDRYKHHFKLEEY